MTFSFWRVSGFLNEVCSACPDLISEPPELSWLVHTSPLELAPLWQGILVVQVGKEFANKWLCPLHSSRAGDWRQSMSLPWYYLRLKGSSVVPFPFKLGWKVQKLNKKRESFISKVTALPPAAEAPSEHVVPHLLSMSLILFCPAVLTTGP